VRALCTHLQRNLASPVGHIRPDIAHAAARRQGAVAVSAYVTHGVFPRASYTRFIQANGTPGAFTHFWITDSCPRTVAAVGGQAPFQIISLAAPIAAALQI